MVRGVHKYYLYRNSSHVLMLPLHSTVISQSSVSQTRKLLHMTQFKIQNDHFVTLHIWALSTLFTENIECLFSVHIPNLSLSDEKIEPCIQDKCYKPYNQVKMSSRTCLSKSIIIYDMIDFMKAITCSETTHVSTKQRLAVKFASF